MGDFIPAHYGLFSKHLKKNCNYCLQMHTDNHFEPGGPFLMGWGLHTSCMSMPSSIDICGCLHLFFQQVAATVGRGPELFANFL